MNLLKQKMLLLLIFCKVEVYKSSISNKNVAVANFL